jgi:outer membrane protein TolC
MKKTILLLIIIIQTVVFSDAVSIDEIRQDALKNSPLQQKIKYNQSIKYLEIQKLRTNYYPSVSFSAGVTYQSDVFNLPFELPANLGTIPEISKDQYNLQFDINQTIYDGGITGALKEIKNTENDLNNSYVNVSIYQINEIVNNLYFGIIKSDAAIKSLLLVLEDLSAKRKILVSSVKNGVLLKSDLNALDIELNRVEQQLIELKSNRLASLNMLEKWTERDLSNAEFSIPDEPSVQTDSQRPELALFDAKKSLSAKKKNVIESEYMPKIRAFVQTGYGKPTPVNMLVDDFTAYYRAGLQLQWNLWQWNKRSREIEIAEIDIKTTDADEKNFLRAIDIELSKHISNIEKYKELIAKDQRMLELQKENVDIIFSKLQNGVINTTEYITEQNILSRLIITGEIHKIDLIKSKYELLYAKGAFNNSNGVQK